MRRYFLTLLTLAFSIMGAVSMMGNTAMSDDLKIEVMQEGDGDVAEAGQRAPVTLGQATPEDLLQAQKDGVLIVDIRRADEWAQTGVIEGAKTITAFRQMAAYTRIFSKILWHFFQRRIHRCCSIAGQEIALKTWAWR